MSFRFLELDCDPAKLSPLTLAFIGDCVFELFVREEIVCEANRPVKELHALSIKKVCCKSQCEKFLKIKDVLTSEETEIYKRGRNAHTLHKPKSVSRMEYMTATGVEALFGYLYLKGELDRLRVLFDKMFKTEESR